MAEQLTAAEKARAAKALDKPRADWTRSEARAVDKARRIAEAQARDELLRALPKALYCELAGRQQKVVDGQARTYKLPALLGRSVNLFEAIDQLHELIAHNRGHLAPRGESLQAELADEERRAKLLGLQLENEKRTLALRNRRRELVDVAELGELLGRLVDRLRTLGARLEAKFGPDGPRLLGQLLDELEQDLRKGLPL